LSASAKATIGHRVSFCAISKDFHMPGKLMTLDFQAVGQNRPSARGDPALDGSYPAYILNIYIFGEAMKIAKLFKNGESQAVRLPKEFRFKGTEVYLRRMGNAVVLLPKTKSWDTLIDSLAKFPPDFMSDREQPGKADRRESFP